MNISVIPFYSVDLNNTFFDKDKLYNFSYYIKKYFETNNYEINTVDITTIKEADYLIFFDLNLKYIFQAYFANKLHKSIYIPFEPPVIDSLHEPKNLKLISKIFGTVFTWQDDLVDNEKIFKFHFPMPSQSINYEEINFKDKLFITTIVGYKKSNKLNELYSKRIEAIKYFERKYNDFEFFGAGWDKNQFKSYKGKVDNKYEILKKYKFTLCYENECNINGLVSEKIFDCFYARTIPIYWGAENISDYFPAKTYIDKRNFKTNEELDAYLLNMDENEYNQRINEIERYLTSDKFKLFSSDNFARNIFEQIRIKEINQQPLVSLISLIFKKLQIQCLKLIKKRFK